jgi:hypothetical protein
MLTRGYAPGSSAPVAVRPAFPALRRKREAQSSLAADTDSIEHDMPPETVMNRLAHTAQRLNDSLFVLVLAAAAASAGLLAFAAASEPAPVLASAPLQVQLERVVVSAKREPVQNAGAACVELPRVVVSARRPAELARAAAIDPNS